MPRSHGGRTATAIVDPGGACRRGYACSTGYFGVYPLQGLSGLIRKAAYRYSEGRAAHWLLLLAGDRVDAAEGHLRSLVSLHPDNPITETGVLSEFKHRPIASRFGQKRADVVHKWLDPIIVAGPWLAAGGLAYAGLRAARKSRRRGR